MNSPNRHQENVKTGPGPPGGITVPLVLPGLRWSPWSAFAHLGYVKWTRVDQRGPGRTTGTKTPPGGPGVFRGIQDRRGPRKNIFLMEGMYLSLDFDRIQKRLTEEEVSLHSAKGNSVKGD
ncbi:hypothetical protein B9Z19DRAFT_1136148 [Tuber borchii]|uniref:Uncharacterized protein n=1 Tax=Tuber borchii TaxID=42251 RepID=A0A2T6ZBY4_TUBBO|nr:hypothetical protein B9Z19DRAFT_1136148 [Tuber borchii]